MHAVCTQCKLLYVGNYLNPSFGPFSQVCCSITGFLRFLCIEDVAHLNATNFHPFSAILAYFHPVLLHVLCYSWMVDYDDEVQIVMFECP